MKLATRRRLVGNTGPHATRKYDPRYGLHFSIETAETVVNRAFRSGAELDIVDLGGRFGLRLSQTQNAVPTIRPMFQAGREVNLNRKYPAPKGYKVKKRKQTI